MSYKKGNDKKGGRTKGIPNKSTAKAKELIVAAIDNQSAHFNKVMGKLKTEEPREWAKIMVKLMDFVLPKKVDVTTDGESLNKEPTKITLSNGTIIDL
jgi:hypothetical protein